MFFKAALLSRFVLLAHISDIHLGRRQYGLDARAKDYEEAFLNAVDKLVKLREERGLEAVLVTGDVFDGARPTPSMYMAAIRGFTALRSAGLSVFAIRGNHDASPINPTENPLKVLGNTGVLRFLDDEYVDLGDVRVIGLGCRPGERGHELSGMIRSMMDGRRRTIVMLHQYIRGTPYRYSMPDLDYFAVGDDLPEEPYYALGHIHEHALRHPRLRGAYAGSLEVWDSSEFETYELVGGELRLKKPQDEKGFLLLDVGSDVVTSKVRLEPRRRMIRLIVGINGDEPNRVRENIASALDKIGISNAYVIVELRGVMHDGYKLRDYGLRDLRDHFDALKVDIDMDLRRRSSTSVGGVQYYGINEIIRNILINNMKGAGDGASVLINSVLDALTLVEQGEVEKAINVIRRSIGLNSEGGPH